MPYASNAGVRIRYEIDGSGVPLVLHPGFIGSLEDWEDAGYVSALSARYRLIRLDPRGQGRSDTPHDPAAYAVENRVDDVLAVLDVEGFERAHFWGYSMGGAIGLALGRKAPQRLRALVLGAAAPFHESVGARESDGMLDDLRSGMATLVSKWEAAVPNLWLSDGERDRWLVADPNALAAARVQRLSEPYIAEQDLSGIAVPTLLYVGTNDSSVVQDALERSSQRMPSAELVILEGLDHAQTFARSDLVLPHVLAFLAQVHGSIESQG